MESVYRKVLRFKKKYPLTIGWRLKQNSSIVERHLNPDEEVIYAFVAQKRYKEAADCLEKALRITNNKDSVYIIYYNLAVINFYQNS